MSQIRKLAVAVLALVPAPAPAQDFFDQLWPEGDVFIKLNDNSRLFFLIAGTRVKSGGYSDGQLGAHADSFISPVFFKRRLRNHPDMARSKFLQIRVGYLFGKTPEDAADPFTEHTPTIEFTPRWYFPKDILVTDRSRFDARFIDGVFNPRYRNRLKVERSLRLWNHNFTPYVHAEIFYDWMLNGSNRARFAAGSEFELSEHFVIESYYLHQRDWRPNPGNQNVFGVGLQCYFR